MRACVPPYGGLPVLPSQICTETVLCCAADRVFFRRVTQAAKERRDGRAAARKQGRRQLPLQVSVYHSAHCAPHAPLSPSRLPQPIADPFAILRHGILCTAACTLLVFRSGWTPLMLAADANSLPYVHTLLAHKADVNVKSYIPSNIKPSPQTSAHANTQPRSTAKRRRRNSPLSVRSPTSSFTQCTRGMCRTFRHIMVDGHL